MKQPGFIFTFLLFAFSSRAQPAGCVFKSAQVTINFGTGTIPDLNTGGLLSYQRISGSCPQDGYYSIVPATSRCFTDDWHTLQDHTGNGGNMLLVNGAPYPGTFLNTPIAGLKSNKVYELCLWLVNLCKPTRKCPFPLLPDLNIRLLTPEGKTVASVLTGDVPRLEQPQWRAYRTYFTAPASTSTLMLVMSDRVPGGCGNDFAVDDITFRECVKLTAQTNSAPMPTRRLPTKPPPKKTTVAPQKKGPAAEVINPGTDTIITTSVTKQTQEIIPPAPPILQTRDNALARKIEAEAGEIKIDVYDNGVIDGDSVSIYHNNILIKSHMLLSQKPISFTINLNPSQPHHEIIMVADNLGSIPPNTSVMVITTSTNRYQVFISSDEQKNAKVVFDLKK